MAATIPFENATPDRLIWVSPDGDDANSGSRDEPLGSIQLAVDRASPGTAIFLEPGRYIENVEFDHIEGTTEKPIWLVAAEGPGTATIAAASNDRSVVTVQGEDNIIIRDLAIEGGRNGIQFSQSGTDYTDLVDNAVIEGNTVTDAVEDGIKISQTNNIRVADNVVDSANEEGVDFVGVTGGEISGNEISNIAGPSAALFAKGGSSDILVADNYVHDITADGILVGGWSSAGGSLPGTDYEARNVEVFDNVVERADKHPLAVLGGEDVDIHDNDIASTEANDYVVYVGAGGPERSPRPLSENVSIHDNVFDRSESHSSVEPSSEGVRLFDNTFDGEISGDMREDPPEPSGPMVDSLPEMLLETPAWPMSARFDRLITGTSENDTLVGGNGHDFLSGAGGEDTMAGGPGDDSYDVTVASDAIIEKAGEGADTAHVHADSYTLGDNAETLVVRTTGGGTFSGNSADNMLSSGKGDDVLAGGAGDDLFVFRPDDGQDTVLDFAAGPASRDTIDLTELPEIQTLDDVLSRSGEVGGDTVISFGSDNTSLTLSDVAMADLTRDDFLLSQPDDDFSLL